MRFFDGLGVTRRDFDDFRTNGLLLPATEGRALSLGMPLHRGPHLTYNAMVIERVGRIESSWSQAVAKDPCSAAGNAIFRLALLQAALRKRLLLERHLMLNRKDPLGSGFDFSELDAMAETLWQAT